MQRSLEHGRPPWVSQKDLQKMGFKIVAYPLTLLATATQVMQRSLEQLLKDEFPKPIMDFPILKDVVGFTEYHKNEKKYRELLDQGDQSVRQPNGHRDGKRSRVSDEEWRDEEEEPRRSARDDRDDDRRRERDDEFRRRDRDHAETRRRDRDP